MRVSRKETFKKYVQLHEIFKCAICGEKKVISDLSFTSIRCMPGATYKDMYFYMCSKCRTKKMTKAELYDVIIQIENADCVAERVESQYCTGCNIHTTCINLPYRNILWMSQIRKNKKEQKRSLDIGLYEQYYEHQLHDANITRTRSEAVRLYDGLYMMSLSGDKD